MALAAARAVTVARAIWGKSGGGEEEEEEGIFCSIVFFIEFCNLIQLMRLMMEVKDPHSAIYRQ